MTANSTASHGIQSQDRWWMSDGLSESPAGLALDGVALAPLAEAHGTPLYVHSELTLRRRLGELRAALQATGAPSKIYFAMKCNRFGPVLEVMRREGDLGLDTCSPREVERALAHGFAPSEISFTAGNLSERDLARVADAGPHVNLDTRSALRRWAAELNRRGARGEARKVGLRLDPKVKVGWRADPKLSAGDSKFGFAFDEAEEVARYAAGLGLEVDELHVHAGWAMPRSAADDLGSAFAQMAEVARAIPSVRVLDVGGGLGWRYRADDDPLTPAIWSGLLRQHLAPTGRTIVCEPGTYVAASAGVLLCEVTTVELRRGVRWIGLNAGHNINVFAAHYGIPLAIVPLRRPLAEPVGPANIAGNINEANDVFARERPMPELEEGEWVALAPAGAYGQSMASDHCMRGFAGEILIAADGSVQLGVR